MRNKGVLLGFLGLALVTSFILVPIATKAQTTDPQSQITAINDQINALLKQLVVLLTMQLQDLQQQLAVKMGQQPATTTPAPAATATTAVEATATSTAVAENKPPRVNITYPSGGLEVSGLVDVSASAADEDGKISQVEFFAGKTSLGVAKGSTAPWTVRWTPPSGNHTLTAKATDDKGAVTTSSPVAITAKSTSQAAAEGAAGFQDIPPTITIALNPTSASTTTNVVITATPATYAGSISRVVFYRAASTTSATVETRTAAPWTSSTTLPAVGVHTISATATNSQGSTKNSGSTTINVCNSGTC